MKKMLFFLILMVPAFDAGGATYSVDCNDPAADFSSIQDAIDAASHGDTIVVKPCTYNENINFKGKAIEIRSLHPHNPNVVSATIISASSGYAVTFEAAETSDSVLTGLTITGRGILCTGSSPVISKNIITNCNNNGVTCQSTSSPLLRDNLITSNSPSGVRESRGDIIDNIITHNGPESGIYVCYGKIIGNEIANNISVDSGGGIYQGSGDIL
ncbi:MAG: right-handed parallel beta-helix repeat-containing protein, partial [Planctomycetota bacterium]